MNKILYGMIIVLWIAANGHCQEATQLLHLTIKSDKSVYKTGEDITVKLKFKNTSNTISKLKLDKGVYAYFGIYIKKDGEQLRVSRRSDVKDMWVPTDIVELKPQEFYEMDFILNKLDWADEEIFSQSGIYEINIIYFGHTETFEKHINSNTISIKIIGQH